MKPELLIHIGHGKTGSTAIQKCLRAAAPDLEANGIYFPDPAKHDNHQDIFVHLTGRFWVWNGGRREIRPPLSHSAALLHPVGNATGQVEENP